MAVPSSARPERRDFLCISAAAFGVVGVGLTVWPMFSSLTPNASSRAKGRLEFDLADIKQGRSTVLDMLGTPVELRHRTQEEVDVSRSVELSDLFDRKSRNSNAPSKDARDRNRSVGVDGRFIVVVPVCTFKGCRLQSHAGNFGGWFCPCHGSHFDVAGRVRAGPAPHNLKVPLYRTLGRAKIEFDPKDFFAAG